MLRTPAHSGLSSPRRTQREKRRERGRERVQDKKPHRKFSNLGGKEERGPCPPLVTVGELHVQAVAAEEGAPAQRGLQAVRVGDGFTDEHQALQGGL